MSGYDNVGGLVGRNHFAPIVSSYATGDVTGNSEVGGLVGRHFYGAIISSYATGSVSGNENVGGMSGSYVSGSVTASYWDTQTSGQSTSDGGEGKTTSELQAPTSNTGIYATWDNDVWDFGTSSQYPALRDVGAITPAAPAGICDRTPQVRDRIVAAIPGVNDCALVTAQHLSSIRELELWIRKIEGLKAGDFSGLTILENLNLRGNQLTALPNGVFNGLMRLEQLNLQGNQLTALPNGVFNDLARLEQLNLEDNQLTTLPNGVFNNLTLLEFLELKDNQLTALPNGVFNGLTRLEQLYLYNNQLTALPDGVFSGLTRLQFLGLSDNRLTALPNGVFNGLTRLERLYLRDNQLTTLPNGVFSGLTSLVRLSLQRNSVSPLPLPVSLEAVGTEGQFRAVAPTGAPFSLILPLSVSGGEIQGGATTITIPIGATESALLTAQRARGGTDAVIVNIARPLPALPGNHFGYRLTHSDALPLSVLPAITPAAPAGICDRTPQVRDGIVEAIPGVNDCALVTAQHLSSITRLHLGGREIEGLKAGDFSGLTILENLNLQQNQLTTLPTGVFNGLTGLEQLSLQGNQFTTLPNGVFNGLTRLEGFTLNGNRLTTLPNGVFNGLTRLEFLDLTVNRLTELPNGVFNGLTRLENLGLTSNQLTTLPTGVFNSLTRLERLSLQQNQLTALPNGVFNGLTRLEELALGLNQLTKLPNGVFIGLTGLEALSLGGNSVSPLPLPVSLEAVGTEGQFRAVAPTGAPFALILPLSVSGGGIQGGATTITIPIGATQSALLTASRAPGGTDAVIVNIARPLPALPEQHSGYRLTPSAALPLSVLPAATAPTGICDRTPQVREGIVEAIPGVNDCALVTAQHLSSITRLHLGGREIEGLKAGDFSGLTILEYLDLTSNQLSGSIPIELGNLSNLVYLGLDENRLSGSIPAELGSLSNLEYLWLYGNQLSGPIPPELGGLANLQWLLLMENRLSGSIPAELGNLSNLVDLILHGNQLSGSIPPELGNLSNLTWLDLHDNQLTGVLPQSLTNLTLRNFAFGDNAGLCAPTDAAFQAWLQGIPNEDIISVGITPLGPNCEAAVGTTTRSFSRAHVEPGGEVVVTLAVGGYGGLGQVVETLPEGFNYVSSSLIQPQNQVGRQITFTLLGETSFTYTVAAPGIAGSYSFSGVLLNSERAEGAIGGASVITVGDLVTADISYAAGSGDVNVRLNAPVSLSVSFSKPVTGFTVEDIEVVNGIAGNLSGSGPTYAFEVTPNAVGEVTVDIAADVATDASGNGNAAAARLPLGIPYDDDGNGVISKVEAILAAADYFSGLITKSQAIAVASLYFPR